MNLYNLCSTLSHANGGSSSPLSLWHTTQSSGESTSTGCRGRSDNFEFGRARKSVVFCEAAMLRRANKHSYMADQRETCLLDDIYSDQWLVSCGFCSTLRFFGSKTQFAICSVLTKSNSHHAPVVRFFVWSERKMCHSATASIVDLAAPLTTEIRPEQQ